MPASIAFVLLQLAIAAGDADPLGRRGDTPSASCAAESIRSSGAVHYYCDCGPGAAPGCIPGDDTQSGGSPSAPRRTGWKEKFRTIRGGDTVALCRGGSFAADTTHTRNPNCTAERTCDLRDYADPRFRVTGKDTRPIVHGGKLIYLYNTPATRGYRYLNLQVKDEGVSTGNPVFAHGDHTDVDICNVAFRDVSQAVYWETPLVARWTIRQSQFERLGQAVLGACTDCVVDGNYFANTSYQPNVIFNHNVYLTHGDVARMKIINNEIHGCAPGTSTGTSQIVKPLSDCDLLIENNLIQCDHASGVSAHQQAMGFGHGGYNDQRPAYHERMVIRRNWIVDQTGTAIDLSLCQDCIVEDNVIIMAGKSPAISVGTFKTRGGFDRPSARNAVRNNTVYYPTAFSGATAIRIMNEGSGHVITGNVVYFEGNGTCFALETGATGSYTSHNACKGTWGTLPAFGAIVLTKSPFVRAGVDFTPAPGSPLVGAASTVTTCTIAGRAGQACTSPIAIGEPTWSARAAPRVRAASRGDVGAMEH